MNIKSTPEKRIAFLSALSATGNVSKAALAVGVDRTSVYNWRAADPAFAEEWKKAMAIGYEALEDEAKRRAFEGVSEMVYYQGVAHDTIRRYSDTLAIFLLKGGMPEKYAERSKSEITNPDGSLAAMNEAQVASRLAAIQQAAQKRKQAEELGDDEFADLV